MPECPRCHEKTESLLQVKVIREFYHTQKSWDEKLENIRYHKTISRQFRCPRCGKPLFKKESTAMSFLSINETSEW
jgi:hypothetical protein